MENNTKQSKNIYDGIHFLNGIERYKNIFGKSPLGSYRNASHYGILMYPLNNRILNMFNNIDFE